LHTASTAGAGEWVENVVAASSKERSAMMERGGDRAGDHGSVSKKDTDAHESALDRLRTENNQLRDLVVCLTSLLVKNVADRR
jgi:hypothetical protein